MEANCSSNQSYPVLSQEVILATQITSGITCLLSIFGASLTIFTYAAFKALRTKARQLLVSLSVADIVVALSHFVGLFVNYKRFISFDEEGGAVTVHVSNTSFEDAACITQGAFSTYGTIASFIFSMMIALYLLVLTQSKSGKPASRLLPFMYIVGWGVPLAVVISVSVVHSFGFEPISTPGWCFTTGTRRINTFAGILADILSYELWALLCFVLLTVLYTALFCSIHAQCKACKRTSDKMYGPAKGDVKLLFVPLIFILLRAWTSATDIGLDYVNPAQQITFKCSRAAAALSVLSGIGLNAQGFVNAILFCAFTKQVRERLLHSPNMWWTYCNLRYQRRYRRDYVEISYSAQFEHVKVLSNNGRPYGANQSKT